MADVEVRDVLLRIGGRTLHRTGMLAAMGAGRGYVEVKETFARAGVRRFRDRDVANGTVALGRRATNDKIAIEYPGELSGLVDSAGLPYCGPNLFSARTQLVADPENFNNWTAVNVTRTAGQADPFGGTAAYKLDATVGADNRIQQGVAGFTAGTRAVLVFLRADPTSAQSNLIVKDNLGAVTRHQVRITWTAGVPSLSTIAGTGTPFGVAPWGAGWYVILINADNVVAGDLIMIYPAATGGTGTVYAFGCNAWNSPFPSPYQAPGEAAGAADSLLAVFNQGPGDITVLTRVARPSHADATVDLGIEPATFRLSTAVPRVRGNFQQVGRLVRSFLSSTGLDVQQTVAIPAGNPLAWITQYRNFSTASLTRLDIGTGLTADSPAANAIAAFGNQVVEVGANTATHVLSGVLLDLMFIRGQRTLAEALAVP